MDLLTARNLFSACIIVYLISAGISLVLIKRQKACNIASNMLCIAASVLGAAASIIKILSGGGPISLKLFNSSLPFMSFDIKVDDLSAFFVLSLSVLALCVSIYSIGYMSHYIGKRNVGLFNFLYSSFILSMMFVLTASNAVFFYISWELMSLVSYFLVIFEAEKQENQRAGTLYIIMTHIATAFLLIGFVIIYSHTNSFDIYASTASVPEAVKNFAFVLFLIGFGTKAGVIPLHIWLPYAHPAAPSNISALMSGIMIKTAIYGLIRFILCYLGIQNTWWGVVILCVGVISAVLGVAYALMEHNIKRLLAFHSVENIGIILIGMGVCFIAIAQGNMILGGLALIASLLHTLNHALFKGGLFLGAGSIQYSAHTKDIEKLGGLIKKMPATALFMLCFSLAISAIVPFNGFISEWLTYQALFYNFASGQALINILSILSVAALGLTGALAAACFVKLFGISFLGLPRSDEASDALEVPAAMNVGMGITAAICLAIGLFPMIIIKVIDRVASSLTGGFIADKMQGGILIAYYPLKLTESSITPITVLIAAVSVILLSIFVIRLIGGKYIERKYGTWDCGFEALNSRMQYTATGYSKPIKIVFKFLFRPSRKVEVTGDLSYHPESIEYKVTAESIFEKYMYNPIYDRAKRFSKWMKHNVQTGSIQSYLIYIFAALLILMAYNRFA